MKKINYMNAEKELEGVWEAIASYMDDEIREEVHSKMAPCTRWDFLVRYLEKNPEFEDLLASEFDMSLGR